MNEQTQDVIVENSNGHVIDPINYDVTYQTVSSIPYLERDNQLDPTEYPPNLWDYLTLYPDDMPSLPKAEERNQLLEVEDGRRRQLWDYFFEIKDDEDEDEIVNQLGKSQFAEIEKLKAIKASKKEAFEVLRSVPKNFLYQIFQPRVIRYIALFLGASVVADRLWEYLGRWIDYWQEQITVAPSLNVFSLITPFFWCSLPVFVMGMIFYFFTTRTKEKEVHYYLEQFELGQTPQYYQSTTWAVAKVRHIFSYVIVDAIAYVVAHVTGESVKPSEPTPQRRILLVSMDDVRAFMKDFSSGIERIKTQYLSSEKTIDERIDNLYAYIEHLHAQKPIPPTDAQVKLWLEEDLKRLQQESIERTSLTIDDFVHYEDDGTEKTIENPVVFVSPGEIQNPERIPPPYRPTVVSEARPTSVLPNPMIESLSSMAANAVSHRLQPQPIPDLAKHLLATKQVEGDYEKFFGVYYIQYLIVGQDMLVLHNFFFDFIMNKVTGERITEQYYQDVTSLEQSKEHRTIPVEYGSLETLEIEDAPTIGLTLPSGDHHYVTFVNETYLKGITTKYIGEDGIAMEMQKKRMDELEVFARTEADKERQKADASLGVLRHHLRHHKVNTH